MPDAVSLSPEALELKRRGRRRLLGAVTIALVLVVFVPMILDSEPRKAGKEIALTIPARDGQPALPAPGTAPAKPETKPAAESAPADRKPAAGNTPPVAPSANTESNTEAKAALKPDASQAPPVALQPPKPEAKADPKVAEVKPAATKAEVKSAAKPAEAKPAEAKPAEAKPASKVEAKPETKPAAKPEAKSDPKKPEGFVVQLGAFSDADKVKQLVAKLKAAKIPVYTEQIKGDAGNLTRVRAGPYKTREAADKAVPQVKKAGGENGKVVPL